MQGLDLVDADAEADAGVDVVVHDDADAGVYVVVRDDADADAGVI